MRILSDEVTCELRIGRNYCPVVPELNQDRIVGGEIESGGRRAFEETKFHWILYPESRRYH